MTNPISFTIGRESIVGAPIAVNFAVNGRDSLWRAEAVKGTVTGGGTIPAGVGYRTDVAGSWETYTAQFREGTELVVKATYGPLGIRKESAKVIRIDDRAPYQRLYIPTAQHGNSTLMTVGIEGRFQFLLPEQVDCHPNSILDIKLRETSAPWQVEVMRPGAVIPDVVNKTMVVDGETLSFATAKRKRALRL